jgi:hypothetical protein
VSGGLAAPRLCAGLRTCEVGTGPSSDPTPITSSGARNPNFSNSTPSKGYGTPCQLATPHRRMSRCRPRLALSAAGQQEHGPNAADSSLGQTQEHTGLTHCGCKDSHPIIPPELAAPGPLAVPPQPGGQGIRQAGRDRKDMMQAGRPAGRQADMHTCRRAHGLQAGRLEGRTKRSDAVACAACRAARSATACLCPVSPSTTASSATHSASRRCHTR